MALQKRRRTKRPRRNRRDAMRKGIYILPSSITTLALFFGFFAIIRSFEGRYEEAAIGILIAALLDFLDGYVARITNTTSEFGVQYDSLADLVSFGLAPGILAYTWALQPFGRIGWLAGFLYFACAALRLARFNVQVDDVEKNYFQGLPTTGAGAILATWVLFHYYVHQRLALEIEVKLFSVVLGVYGLAFLMVSSFRYRNLKRIGLRERHPFQYLVVIVLLLILIASNPMLFLFPLGCIYVIHGPLGSLVFYRRRKQEKFDQKKMTAAEHSANDSWAKGGSGS